MAGRPRSRGWAAILALGLALAAPKPALAAPERALAAPTASTPPHARDRGRVLLLTDTPGDPLMVRVRAEVLSLGLEVVVRPAEGAIQTRARAEHAVAAIRMLPSRNGVEVWTADEMSGRPLLRQAIVDDKPGGTDRTLIALETAEVLRTSLFPHPPPEPPRVIIQIAPPVAPAPPARAEAAIVAGVGLLYGGGGAGPAWQAELSLQRLWTEHLGAALDLSVPIHRGTMSGPEGTADVGAITAGVAVLARFASDRRRLCARTSLGAAFVSVLTTGHPATDTAPLLGASSAAYTALAYARAALGWQASRWVSLGVNGVAGTALAPVRVRFAGNDAGSWGAPLLGVSVFAELDWH